MKSILSLLVCAITPLCASAEINVGYTAEWLSHQSSLIAKAAPIHVENIKGPGEVWFTKSQFRLETVIKGPMSAGDTVTVYDFSYNEADVLKLSDAKKESRQILIFAKVAEHLFQEIDGKYAFTETHIFKSAYFADQKVTNLFRPDFKLLATYKELLERTNKQVLYEADLKRRHWKGTIAKKSLDIPSDSEAFRHLYAGSSCYLWVPEYKPSK